MSVKIIAEAGVNHNGSIQMAYDLIDAAVNAGADIVKFQTFKAATLVSKNAQKADYQKRTSGASESQFEMLKKLELSDEQHQLLIDHCAKKKIEFLSTPFDSSSLDLLVKRFHLKQLKISSGDLTNAPLLLHAANSDVDVIISSGMATLQEIEDALGVLAFGYLRPGKNPKVVEIRDSLKEGKSILQKRVALLHCTSEYPAPFAEINLRVMKSLREKYGLVTGLSDHSKGYSVPVAAVALGAEIIEKHFTLDRELPGPDHQASLEPSELKEMVRSIREVELALGSDIKQPTPSEMKNLKIARKSLVASRDIRKGEAFSSENMTIKRPGEGVSPLHYWEWLGKLASRDFKEDEVLD